MDITTIADDPDAPVLGPNELRVIIAALQDCNIAPMRIMMAQQMARRFSQTVKDFDAEDFLVKAYNGARPEDFLVDES